MAPRLKAATQPTLSAPNILIGYARVSEDEQILDLQLNALKRAGCAVIHQEKVSAVSKKRPMLDLAIKQLMPGDTLVVWRLDRLIRDVRDFYERLGQIHEAGSMFRSLMEHFDVTTAHGEFAMLMAAGFAQFERQSIIERTKAGMDAAKARGKRLGAPIKFTAGKKTRARKWLAAKVEVAVVARRLGLSPGTISNWIKSGKP